MPSENGWAVRLRGTDEYIAAVVQVARAGGHRSVNEMIVELIDNEAAAVDVEMPSRITIKGSLGPIAANEAMPVVRETTVVVPRTTQVVYCTTDGVWPHE